MWTLALGLVNTHPPVSFILLNSLLRIFFLDRGTEMAVTHDLTVSFPLIRSPSKDIKIMV